MLWVDDRTGIVPGVSQAACAGADVMRGEEVQALGAVAAGLVPRDGRTCHPGTHTKWVRIEDGQVATFTTTVTGELYALEMEHVWRKSWVCAGTEETVRGPGEYRTFDKLGAARRTQAVQKGKELGLLP